jgi:polysaccharide deacetylase family protein (PEP-CTERM system associated)
MPQVCNALSIDVEDYFHVAAFADRISPDDWPRMEYRAERNTGRLLELLHQHAVKATFFVLGWVAEKSPALVRRIHDAGHEVACHGLTHQLVYRQTPQLFRDETRRSRDLLEDITGAKVTGYRAASYSVTRQSLWALDILLDLGFEYDSSIFPIRHDIYGIPDAPTKPGPMPTPQGRSIVEFPLATARLLGLKIPVAGGGYFRLLPYWVTRTGLAQINGEGRPFVFYLHPWEIDPDQPAVAAGWRSRYRHYTNLTRTYGRLERLLGQFRFGTMRGTLRELGLLT